jgi:diguanylate cyclase (GGDEF)-like protein
MAEPIMSRKSPHTLSKSETPTFRQSTRVRSVVAPTGDVRLHRNDSGTIVAAAAATQRHDTPFRPSKPIAMGVRCGTLTVLSGCDAGRIVVIGGRGLVIGRAPDAGLVVEDDAVSRYHARVDSREDGSFTIEDLRSANGTFVGARRIHSSQLVTGDQVQLGRELTLRFRTIDAEEEFLYRALYESSVHDGLTRAFNRRHFSDRLFAEVSRARLANADLAILMIDVDRLKEVNDAFGHIAGDRALCGIVTVIASSIRAGDLLARYGGDELAILAPGTDHEEAVRLAERARRAVEGLRLAAKGQHVHVSVSVGVASLCELEQSGEPHVELLSLADERLYRAKRSGRNAVFSKNRHGS